MNSRFLKHLGILAITLVVATMPASSQSRRVIDGITVGAGIGMYAGDLDGNPTSSVPAFVGSGHLSLFVGVDRHLGGAIGMGLEAHYNRVRGTNEFVDGAHNMLSVELLARLIPSRYLGVYMGLAPGIIVSQYARLSPAAVLDGEATEDARFALTIPIGIMIQENIRVGIRFSASDLLDGKASGSNNDVLGVISIGYRFGR